MSLIICLNIIVSLSLYGLEWVQRSTRTSSPSFSCFSGLKRTYWVIRLERVHLFFVLFGFWFFLPESTMGEGGRTAIVCVVTGVHVAVEMLIWKGTWIWQGAKLFNWISLPFGVGKECEFPYCWQHNFRSFWSCTSPIRCFLLPLCPLFPHCVLF